MLSVGEERGIPVSQISVFQGGKDCIEAIKLDLGYEAFVEDMYNGKGQNLALKRRRMDAFAIKDSKRSFFVFL